MKGNFIYQDAGLWDYTHFRWYTFNTGIQLLQQTGFKVELATVSGDLTLNSFFKKIISANTREFLFSLLIKISKGFFGYQLLYRAVKINEPRRADNDSLQ